MTQIQLQINGEATMLTPGQTVRDVVATRVGKQLCDNGLSLDGSRLGVAIAVDGAVVPRSTWSQYRLQAGQQIEFVTAAQGG